MKDCASLLTIKARLVTLPARKNHVVYTAKVHLYFFSLCCIKLVLIKVWTCFRFFAYPSYLLLFNLCSRLSKIVNLLLTIHTETAWPICTNKYWHPMLLFFYPFDFFLWTWCDGKVKISTLNWTVLHNRYHDTLFLRSAKQTMLIFRKTNIMTLYTTYICLFICRIFHWIYFNTNISYKQRIIFFLKIAKLKYPHEFSYLQPSCSIFKYREYTQQNLILLILYLFCIIRMSKTVTKCTAKIQNVHLYSLFSPSLLCSCLFS